MVLPKTPAQDRLRAIRNEAPQEKPVKVPQPKNYYAVLGIEKSANETDIKKAYHRLALVHHPDRHSNASDEVKREQERQFKEVGEAYSVLSSRYDVRV